MEISVIQFQQHLNGFMIALDFEFLTMLPIPARMSTPQLKIFLCLLTFILMILIPLNANFISFTNNFRSD
jgi:hypothetical protein